MPAGKHVLVDPTDSGPLHQLQLADVAGYGRLGRMDSALGKKTDQLLLLLNLITLDQLNDQFLSFVFHGHFLSFLWIQKLHFAAKYAEYALVLK